MTDWIDEVKDRLNSPKFRARPQDVIPPASSTSVVIGGKTFSYWETSHSDVSPRWSKYLATDGSRIVNFRADGWNRDYIYSVNSVCFDDIESLLKYAFD